MMTMAPATDHDPVSALRPLHVTEVYTVVVSNLLSLADVLAGHQEHCPAHIEPQCVGVAVTVEVAGNGSVQSLANLLCPHLGGILGIELHPPDWVSIHIIHQSELVQQPANDQLLFGQWT